VIGWERWNRILRNFAVGALLGWNAVTSLGAEPSALKFAGAPLAPGATVRADVPLSAEEKLYAAQGGNPVPPAAVAVIATPAGFDPKRSWPVLVICSTSDFKRQNRNDLVQFYRGVGLAEGWVLLAGDGPQFPRNDTAGWRSAMTLAALDALHRSFAGSEHWPVACAGFSGGAKGAGSIAPLLARYGNHMIGIYLTGVNEDYLSAGYARCRPGPDFLRTPIFISAGYDDRVATVEQQYAVAGMIKHTGFEQIRTTEFHGGHEVNDAKTAIALRWFRSLQK
jgi:hypothetical protein